MTEAIEVGSLLRKTASGAGWVMAWRAVTRGLGFVSTLVLARLLVPADFGVVALAMSFSQAIDTMVDLGVAESVVRAQAPTKAFYDTAFTLNAIRGAVTALLIAATAGPVAGFFGEPRLVSVLLVLAVSVFVGGFESMGTTDFRRDFAFHNEFQLWAFPRLMQVVVTISLAWTWRSYWALVCGILTARLLRNLGGYMLHPYRPRLTLSTWRQMFNFSFWTWLIGIVYLVRSRVTMVSIGRVLDSSMVGVYSLGAELAALPETEFIEPLCRVSFSSFSATNRMGSGGAETYLRIVATALLVTLPAGVGIAITAPAIVAVAFGPKWYACTPVVQVLALAGLFGVIGRVSASLFSAYAYLRSMFTIAVSLLVVQVPLTVWMVWYWGMFGAAVANSVLVVIEHAIYGVITFRRLHIYPHELLKRIWRPAVATATMAAALRATGLAAVQPSPTVAGLALTCTAGAAIYCMTIVALWLATGRADGAEADLVAVIRHTARATGRTMMSVCLRSKNEQEPQ